ncbi:MAG TPA: IPT/TIG domain-containing protein [Thermoanaerobaculia bacterium]|nr:IPT/TIG domain-containing protein [Thermoanaerobaculia bacterium]HUM30466.1 IPT/TIG domain-containing protein [Thermoanaerobaculia bacterium]HXK68667.1 IPT/TIG domain-containing protein [Thermoanaerobaculia bacterium]
MRTKISLVLLLSFILLTFGCTDGEKTPSSGSPTTPSGDTYTFTSLSADPDPSMAGGATVITAVIRKNGNPLNGETILFSSNLGLFLENGLSSINKIAENGVATVTLYSDTAGDATVTAMIKTATAKITVTFEEDVFFVTKIVPNAGSPQTGEAITISGVGFVDPVTVSFGGRFGEVVEKTLTSITVNLPVFELPAPTADLLVDVFVTRRAGTELEEVFTVTGGFTFLHTIDVPSITGIDPVMGPNDGQTLVTIFGEGFGCPNVQVFFNNVPGAVQDCQAGFVTVLSPNAYDMGIENCNDDVNIKVRNLAWGTEDSYCCFHYGEVPIITAFGPGQALYAGGDIVTIYGHGFDEPVAVSLAEVAAFPISVTETEVVVRAGTYDPAGKCSDFAGKVSITNIECGFNADSSGDFIYKVPKVYITSISPSAGQEGDVITITGQNFNDPMRVTFGDVERPAIFNSSTSIQAEVPVFSDSYDTQECTVGACQGEQYINTPVDIGVYNIFTGCSDELQNAFFYIPTDTSCRIDAPTCGFNFTPASPTAGGGVSFLDTSNGCVDTWNWDFGDGNTSNVQNPSNIYAAAGTYTVTLTVTNAGGSSSCSRIITVNP